MTCLESRRLLLAAPRERSPELQAHLAGCTDCTRLAAELADLDRTIQDAAAVSVPEGLAQRILPPGPRRPWSYRIAAAAAAGIVVTAIAFMFPDAFDVSEEPPISAAAAGPTHPAVQAISFVIDVEPQLLKKGRTDDSLGLQIALKQLGLSLRARSVSVHYLGKCAMAGGNCDHAVLSTPDGYVSVIFVPEQPLSARVLVADRRMVALASPARSGGFIVVAESPKAAKRTEKLFVKDGG